MQTFTDMQIIDAYLKYKNYSAAARKLRTHRNTIMDRIGRMVVAGVELPANTASSGQRYTPERVAQLNAYIKKTQEANARQVS